jgi:hypothetical protein
VLPERVPAEGLLILRDGEPGEPEVTLSPLAYHYEHRAEVEAVVQGADRDATFDTLCASIGAALAAGRTLGGLCNWVEAEAPRPVDLPVEGAASLKAAVIAVVLHCSTADQLAWPPIYDRAYLQANIAGGQRGVAKARMVQSVHLPQQLCRRRPRSRAR